MSNTIPLTNFIIAKNERLASAVYMVTNLMPDAEPLKWRLREKSLELVSDFALSFNYLYQEASDDMSDKFVSVEKTAGKIDDLLSLITVALSGGSVSSMNFTILKQEYNALKRTLQENFSAENMNNYLLAGQEHKFPRYKISAVLPQGVVQENNEREGINQTRPNNSVGSPLSSYSSAQEERGRSPYQSGLSSRTPAIPTSHSVSRDKNILEANRRSPTGENIQKDSRRQIILAHLKGQDWVSIKDISKAVSGCSVKTVQRELVDLVKSHVLEKTGERRWSRYRLV